MKTKEAIIIILGTIISNTAFCQDTAHTRLVDKYYPKSNPVTPEPQNKVPDLNLAPITRTQPLNNNTASQKPVIKNEPISKPVVPQSTVAAESAQVPEPANTISNPSPTPATPPAPATVATSTPDTYPVYRDTRLGSSAPQYDTYKKNDYGAGAITTNPNKSGGGGIVNQNNANASEGSPAPNASENGQIYRGNRLGSSSPLYDTYQKNNYGAGSVTTSPK